jgi:hypothetical protein
MCQNHVCFPDLFNVYSCWEKASKVLLMLIFMDRLTSAIVFISWDKDNKFHQSVKEVMGKAKPTHQNQRTNIFLGEFIGSGSHAILCTIHTDQKKKE